MALKIIYQNLPPTCDIPKTFDIFETGYLLKKFQIIFSEPKYNFADLEDCFCFFPSVVVKILKLVFEQIFYICQLFFKIMHCHCFFTK